MVTEDLRLEFPMQREREEVRSLSSDSINEMISLKEF